MSHACQIWAEWVEKNKTFPYRLHFTQGQLNKKCQQCKWKGCNDYDQVIQYKQQSHRTVGDQKFPNSFMGLDIDQFVLFYSADSMVCMVQDDLNKGLAEIPNNEVGRPWSRGNLGHVTNQQL